MNTTNDPLEILIVPHAVIEWQRNQGLLLKRFFPEQIKREREKGKWAVFHDKLRIRKLFETEQKAKDWIETTVGDKRKCIANKRIYTIRQLI